jgi:hypothetical protein
VCTYKVIKFTKAIKFTKTMWKCNHDTICRCSEWQQHITNFLSTIIGVTCCNFNDRSRVVDANCSQLNYVITAVHWSNSVSTVGGCHGGTAVSWWNSGGLLMYCNPPTSNSGQVANPPPGSYAHAAVDTPFISFYFTISVNIAQILWVTVIKTWSTRLTADQS